MSSTPYRGHGCQLQKCKLLLTTNLRRSKFGGKKIQCRFRARDSRNWKQRLNSDLYSPISVLQSWRMISTWNVTSTRIFRLRKSCNDITCNVARMRCGDQYCVTYFTLLLLNYGIHNTARLSSFYTYVNRFNCRQGITLIVLILALLTDNFQLYVLYGVEYL
jgi:outer membrane protein assembly factor BamA